jgi:hypothetical protein
LFRAAAALAAALCITDKPLLAQNGSEFRRPPAFGVITDDQDSGAVSAQEVNQVKLTEKRIQDFMAAAKDIAKLSDGGNSGKPDAELEAQAEAVVKRNGFASLAEFDDVSTNISMVMSGIDQRTKKFTEPPEQIKQQIAALKVDKSVPEPQKKEDLAQLEAALKTTRPIQFKENIALVLKYFDKLAELMQEQEPAD